MSVPELGKSPDSALPAGSREGSQTLDRGLRLLSILAEADHPLPVAQLAAGLGVHRSVAYRMLRTLEDHRLVRRSADGTVELGVGASILARKVKRSLQSAALPELTALSQDLGATTFLVVEDAGEVVTLVSIEPPHGRAHVAYRAGTRHPVTQGAPGTAVLSALPPQPDEREAVAAARNVGWAHSLGEVVAGVQSVAAPVKVHGSGLAALAVIFLDHQLDVAEIGRRVAAAANRVETALS